VLGDAETGFNIAVSVARNNDFNRKHMEKKYVAAIMKCSRDAALVCPKAAYYGSILGIQPSIQKMTEITASETIDVVLKSENTTDSTRKILMAFMGMGDQTYFEFDPNSQATKELLNSDYMKGLTNFLMQEMTAKYGGDFPEGAKFTEGEGDRETYRNFNPIDGIKSTFNGWDLNDVVGSFTDHITVVVKDGYFYFTGINKTTLESFSGNNIIRHDLVENNDSDKGKYRTVTQKFTWRVPVPKKPSPPRQPRP